MERVRFTNDAAVLRCDPTRYATLSGVRPGEEGEAGGADEERLMTTARMSLEEQYGGERRQTGTACTAEPGEQSRGALVSGRPLPAPASGARARAQPRLPSPPPLDPGLAASRAAAAVAERMAKRAEERARAERLKAEQAKAPPSAVDDSKRRVPRRTGAGRTGWGAVAGGDEEDEGEGEEGAAGAGRGGDGAAAQRDARELGYATGFVSDLEGVPGRSTFSDRVRDMLVWDVEEAEEEEAEEEAGAKAGATASRAPAAGRTPKGIAARHPRGSGALGATSDPSPAEPDVGAVPFEPRSTAEWNPRSYRLLPPSWTAAIPRAGMPSARSEPASAALLMFA